MPCLGQLSTSVPISHGHMDEGHNTNLVPGGSTWHRRAPIEGEIVKNLAGTRRDV